MPTYSYNLVDESWIPCTFPDGARRDLGLADTLLQAHRIREITDPSPLVTVSLHRLLLAILHRSHRGPANLDDWQALWRREQWDPDVVGGYLDAWRHRFDLFDAERPFYQGTSLGPLETRHPVARLAQEVATGNNATLFDHGTDRDFPPLTPAAAARYLVAHQTFAIGFGKSQPFYLKDSPALRGYNVLALGDNVFHSLALNLLPYNAERPIPWHGDDLPAWEHEPPPIAAEAGSPVHGYVDYLTWQSRRIHLVPEGVPTVVSSCQFRQHLYAADLPSDPFKAYRTDPNRGRFARGLNADRAVWRDSHALFQRASPVAARPELFNHLARVDGLRRAGAITARSAYRIAVFGVATDIGKAASVVLWRQERLPLPLAYLDDEDLLAALDAALRLAENVGRLFTAGFVSAPRPDNPKASAPKPLQVLADALLPRPAGLAPDRAAVERLVAHLGAEPRFWAALDTPFRRLLLDLAADRTADEDSDPVYGDAAIPTWIDLLRRTAWSTFGDATTGLDGSARALKAAALARRSFGVRLHHALGSDVDDVKETRDESADRR